MNPCKTCADGFVREGEVFVKYHFYGKRQFISVIGGAIIIFAGPSFCVHEKPPYRRGCSSLAARFRMAGADRRLLRQTGTAIPRIRKKGYGEEAIPFVTVNS
jgi:hypothetical protein